MLTLQLHRITCNFIISLCLSDLNIFIEASFSQLRMDGLYGISNSKVPKRNSLSSIDNFAPQIPYYHHTGPVLDQYASPEGHTSALKNLNSPFLRYLQSARSQSSSRIEPPRQSRSPFFSNTPVKVEEDVLVMDGVLVKNPPVGRGRSLSSSLTDSGASSSSGGKNYKMDLCLSYLENSGFCRYGMKCQFAHGNKELRPSQSSYKSVLETPCKSYSGSGNCSFGSKCRFLHHETSTATSLTSTAQTVSPIKLDELTNSVVNLKSTEWSPPDDDTVIPTTTGNTPSKEEVDAYISKVLYGPRRIRRLPVFSQICPE